jgi:hypothetical protein
LEISKTKQLVQLEVYVALYKFCFYRGHLDEAENIALDALKESARCSGFDPDWNKLQAESADWTEEEGPARLYLYSLKALAFISLRQDKRELANRILKKLQQLDTEDRVGGSVIMSLADAL